MDIDALNTQMSNSKVVFDFTSRTANEDEKAGTIVSQSVIAGTSVKPYSRVSAEILLPATQNDDMVIGVYSHSLPQYTYVVPLELTTTTNDGEIITVAKTNHTGGSVTIPYQVQKKTTLTLSLLGQEIDTITIQ